MIEKRRLDLQLFTEGGSATDGGEGGGSEAEVQIGDVLEDGTVVDANLASSMRENADMYPTRKRAAHAQGQQQSGESGQQAANGEEPTPEEWAEAKKRFAKFYGNDVQSAVKDRWALCIFLVVFAGAVFLKISPVVYVLAAGVTGILIEMIRGRQR